MENILPLGEEFTLRQIKYLLCLYRIVVCLTPVSTRRTAKINAQVSDVREVRGSMVRGRGGGGSYNKTWLGLNVCFGQ